VKRQIKIAFLSGTPELNRQLIEHVRSIFPELPLWVVSDFPPEDAGLPWIRYRVNGTLRDNLARCREAIRGYEIRLAAVMLVPNVPFRRMRLMALLLSPRGFIAFNENLNHFMLRPAQIPSMARHVMWRMKNALRWWWRTPLGVRTLLVEWAAWLRPRWTRTPGQALGTRMPGTSLVIPSRSGKDLLAAQLPAILAEHPDEIIVVDNGSTDDTAGWLAAKYPEIRVEVSALPLSFARAVNRGIRVARYSHVCLLNNDMLIEPGFFRALRMAFDRIPGLFCATAQIQFPPGVRREETGKTVFYPEAGEDDFPVRCDEPLLGEDESYVLYGSGGCSLYDAAKLASLGNVDEVYEPAYVEDLDLGYRAWQRGWQSVYVAGAVVEHRHRATTSRYFTQDELDVVLYRNYLRFLVRAVYSPLLFRRMWQKQVTRVSRPAKAVVKEAAAVALAGGPATRPEYSEDLFLALCSGGVSVFPGRAARGKPVVMVASPYLPFPLSHGGAVRMYNLMRRAAEHYDHVLVAFTEESAPPPQELLEICSEIVLVRRHGSHELPFAGRPETVEEFDSPAFRSAIHQTVRKWRPAIAQLEFTQMAQYADDCAPARTVLVEHDITFDLYKQLLRLEDTWDRRQQLPLWRRFETQAWRNVDRVVVMSAKDRAMVADAAAVLLPNGVDLDRFRPDSTSPDSRRLLFIGSFAHLPNRLAVEFFLEDVWPALRGATLHIIAGANHERWTLDADLSQAGVELEGFVADVRPAYRRAAVVVAPLVASAGTNIKILEAMAMGKAVVSTPAGVNGLDLTPGEDFLLVQTGAEMASAIESLLDDPVRRGAIERSARARVERDFGWDHIARAQRRMYRELMG
jgi:GT2 family glycosyltransferase/glycosyltransferase involved in cell wall biosynthesis